MVVDGREVELDGSRWTISGVLRGVHRAQVEVIGYSRLVCYGQKAMGEGLDDGFRVQ